MPKHNHFAREIFSADKGRYVFVIQKVTHCLHNLAGASLSEIKSPATAYAGSAKA